MGGGCSSCGDRTGARAHRGGRPRRGAGGTRGARGDGLCDPQLRAGWGALHCTCPGVPPQAIPFHSIPFFEFFPVPLPIPSCAQAAKSTVASTYAMALADTCTDANMKRDTQELEAVHTDMETLSAYIAGNELVAAFLSDPLQEARAAQLS